MTNNSNTSLSKLRKLLNHIRVNRERETILHPGTFGPRLNPMITEEIGLGDYLKEKFTFNLLFTIDKGYVTVEKKDKEG